jgi:hypothetical protein
MLNKKETQTWSVMCDKCHKILDREYLKEVIERMEKQQAQKDNICSLCKENLEGSQILCWNCKCKLMENVREDVKKDILEMIEEVNNESEEFTTIEQYKRKLKQKIKGEK